MEIRLKLDLYGGSIEFSIDLLKVHDHLMQQISEAVKAQSIAPKQEAS